MNRKALVPFLLALAAVASAQSPLDIAKANAAAKRKATLALDAAWFEKTETADYVSISKGGQKKTKTQDIAEMKAMSKSLKVSTVAVKVKSAKMVGKDLIANEEVHIVGTLTGPDGKPHILDLTETSEETWVKVGGVWKQRQDKTLTESGKIDGKPLPG